MSVSGIVFGKATEISKQMRMCAVMRRCPVGHFAMAEALLVCNGCASKISKQVCMCAEVRRGALCCSQGFVGHSTDNRCTDNK
eukprot:338723-Pelagomonas_calceolata.AAC.8